MFHATFEMNAAHAEMLLEAVPAIVAHLLRLLEEFLGGEFVARVLRQMPLLCGSRAC
jgi:hypothetical protein